MVLPQVLIWAMGAEAETTVAFHAAVDRGHKEINLDSGETTV